MRMYDITLYCFIANIFIGVSVGLGAIPSNPQISQFSAGWVSWVHPPEIESFTAQSLNPLMVFGDFVLGAYYFIKIMVTSVAFPGGFLAAVGFDASICWMISEICWLVYGVALLEFIRNMYIEGR